MAFSKVSLWGWVIGLGIMTLVGCGPDPRARFEGDVNWMIEQANVGKYADLEGSLSRAFQARIRSEGWEPKAALVAVARKDREEGARYRLTDVPKFEGSYAEVEIARIWGEREERMVIPFVREEGRWKVGAAYRDGRAWEGD